MPECAAFPSIQHPPLLCAPSLMCWPLLSYAQSLLYSAACLNCHLRVTTLSATWSCMSILANLTDHSFTHSLKL
ncbi:hypothetical protein DFS34DRAFT_605126 [Phlyctochytrium arcticum]|nr:hypothetical protein DFS34DRAFT_605126 [Phlyctochytrium arcticum]